MRKVSFDDLDLVSLCKAGEQISTDEMVKRAVERGTYVHSSFVPIFQKISRDMPSSWQCKILVFPVEPVMVGNIKLIACLRFIDEQWQMRFCGLDSVWGNDSCVIAITQAGATT